ncbi:hypothetical protein QJN85_25855, partial [Escherichia coli]
GTDTAKEILYARMKADPTPADEATSYAIRFPDDPFPSSTPRERKIILTDMVRNGTTISIDLHTGPQKTVPHTVSWRVHPFR